MSAASVLGAFLRRDLAISLSYRVGFALTVVSGLFSLALFFYLGRLVDRSGGADQELQRGYFAFVVVGVALLGVGQTGLTSLGQKFRQEQTTGTFEALMSTPTPPSLVILSSAAYDMVRAALEGLVFVLLGVAVFGLRLSDDPLSILVALVTATVSMVFFVALGVAVAAFTVVFKQVTALLGMVGSGFALLGGVFFPVRLLPEPLRLVSDILPFTWALKALRDALVLGKANIEALVLLVSAAAVSFPVALGLFALAMRRARKTATLGQY